MNTPTNRPTLEVVVRTGAVSAVATLQFLGGGVVSVETDARWCDKAAVFGALEGTLRPMSLGANTSADNVKAYNTRNTACEVLKTLMAGLDAGKVQVTRRWSAGYSETVSSLGAPVQDMALVA